MRQQCIILYYLFHDDLLIIGVISLIIRQMNFEKKKLGIYCGYKPQIIIFAISNAILIVSQYLFIFQVLSYQKNILVKLIQFITVLIFTFTFTNYIKCALRDPGVIPSGNLSSQQATKKVKKLLQNQKYKYNPIQTYQMDQCIQIDHQNPTHQISERQQQQKQQDLPNQISNFRYCNICKQIKEPLASHCYKCGVCVKLSDHHCVFAANCIGVRNHRNFFCFLMGLLLLCLCYIIVCSIILYKQWQKMINISQLSRSITYSERTILIVAFFLLIWAIMISRRFAKIKYTIYFFCVSYTIYLISDLKIKIIFNRQIVCTLIVILISIFTWPIIFGNFMSALYSIMINRTQRQINRQIIEVKLSLRQKIKNVKIFLETKPPKSLI